MMTMFVSYIYDISFTITRDWKLYKNIVINNNTTTELLDVNVCGNLVSRDKWIFFAAPKLGGTGSNFEVCIDSVFTTSRHYENRDTEGLNPHPPTPLLAFSQNVNKSRKKTQGQLRKRSKPLLFLLEFQICWQFSMNVSFLFSILPNVETKFYCGHFTIIFYIQTFIFSRKAPSILYSICLSLHFCEEINNFLWESLFFFWFAKNMNDSRI